MAEDKADGGAGVCEEEEELSEKAGRKMGRRDPAIRVMLSKDSISVCLGRGANVCRRKWTMWVGMEWKRREQENTNTLTVGPQSTTTKLPMASTRFQLGQGCAVGGICVVRRQERYAIR